MLSKRAESEAVQDLGDGNLPVSEFTLVIRRESEKSPILSKDADQVHAAGGYFRLL